MEEIQEQPQIAESIKKFRAIADRDIYEVTASEIDEPLFIISGYELDFQFNMKYIKTMQAIDEVCKGIAQMFKDMLLENLVAEK